MTDEAEPRSDYGIMLSVRRGQMRWLLVSLIVAAVAAAVWMTNPSAAGVSTSRVRSIAATGCPHPTIPVPPNEPVYSAGSTEVVTGLYIQGGAVPPPPCKPEPRGPYAGKVTITNARTGKAVASQSVANGHLAHIRLAPGRYKVSGKMPGGGPMSSATITIRHGDRTRQDVFEDVP